MGAGVHSGWTLRVPVIRPRWVALAEPAVRWLGGAAAACGLAWLGLPAGLAWLLALAAVAHAGARAVLYAGLRAGMRANARAHTHAGTHAHDHVVSALRFTADHALYVRLSQGWRPLALRAAARGWRCLALEGELPAPLSPRRGMLRARRVSFTVWQDALPAPAWRRLSLLSHRSLRRAPVRGRYAPSRPAAAESGTKGTA